MNERSGLTDSPDLGHRRGQIVDVRQRAPKADLVDAFVCEGHVGPQSDDQIACGRA
jgi:hypothetical protein